MQPSGICFRLATAKDVDQVSDLFEELDAHHIRLRPDLFKPLSGPARDRATIETFINASSQALFVGEEPSGVLLGLVHVIEKTTPESLVAPASRFAEIDSLVVKSAHRKTGLAKALLGHAEHWAQQYGLKQLVLNVRAFNIEAVSAYEALGFDHIVHKMAREIPHSGMPS